MAVLQHKPGNRYCQARIELREWFQERETVKWVLVKSKMLTAVAYNRDWQHLYLKFRSGDIYSYRGVEFERYEELLAADSKGTYVRSHMLNRYPYQKVHWAVPTAG